MNEKEKKGIGKFLSLVLRHNPGKIQLELDKNGWADVNELIEKCAKKGIQFTLEELEEIVETNDKKRYSFNEDKTSIRANQGHSIEVDVELTLTTPPEFLYHGTVDKFMDSIRTSGLQKMLRQHVHLSKDLETAIKVGSRRGKPVILTVRSGDMFRAGFPFFLSENQVWLTDAVPPTYIEFKS
jgi:putative RNA 2'-phosphotransferase